MNARRTQSNDEKGRKVNNVSKKTMKRSIGLATIRDDRRQEVAMVSQKRNIRRALLVVGLICSTVPAMSPAQSTQVVAFAVGAGTIPSGEYAGRPFRIEISGEYSAFGPGTLVRGRALLTIGTERFASVVGTEQFPSFCCGEGAVDSFGFSMGGRVRHVTAPQPHEHLFGASATKDGRMCFNLADQSGTTTETQPPHNPGVGLICDIPAVVIMTPR
jgi:hypothetical protein